MLNLLCVSIQVAALLTLSHGLAFSDFQSLTLSSL